jgi:glycosyltransferase involved in cell wall biosynthesis
MKILQINKFFFLKGGAERYFFDLSELLTSQGHQVSVWSTQHSQNFPWPGQENFTQFNDLSQREGFWKDLKKIRDIFWNKQAKNKLAKLIKKEKPDIAHLHNIFSHLSPSIISTLKKNNIPIVLTLHDYKLFCPNYQFFTNGQICFRCLKEKNYRSCLSKKCLKNSFGRSLIGYLEGKWQKDFLNIASQIDIFLAPSLFMKKQALAWGIPADKIIHLPNFITIDKLQDLRQNKKELLAKDKFLPKDEPAVSKERNPYLLYFGRLSQEKGIKLLIKAFLEASKTPQTFFGRKKQSKLANWSLKIVGQGPQKKKLEELVKNKRAQIEFPGEKRGRQLKEIITRADLIIVPSLWPENFPYTILESFALAKPVLAARIGGLPELIKNNKTGLLFKSNKESDLIEKLVWAVEHPKEVKRMGQTAQEEVLAKYSPEKHYQKLIRIYERIKNN